ncbi:DNA repair protein RecN [Owenweeksia hongkongensis]|uniref:DNA repair protein RecN n=1 Tax=Owenweeksia hongkongensis TaxID=253245 RepID=UPI003A8CD054
MLKHLSVKNYALIDKLELDLSSGFSVITGETGAGKSIILGALNLVLGKRADLKVLRDETTKCVVEATFILNQNSFKSFFANNELDFESETLIRREITPSGKSRAFINDTPVTLNVLNDLSSRLIDVHSQHQNLLLADTNFQLGLIDTFAKNEKEITAYAESHKRYQDVNKEIKKITESSDRQSFDLDYVNFLLKELTEAKLESGEQENIEEELKLLENAEEIQGKLDSAVKLIEGVETIGINDGLISVGQSFKQLQNYNPIYKELTERVSAIQIELEDIRQEVEQLASDTEYNPERLEKLDSRLSQLIHLQRKHGAEDIDELISKRDELESKIEEVTQAEERLVKLQADLKEAEANRVSAARKLHQTREKAAPAIEKQIVSILSDLNMNDAQLQIKVSQTEIFTKLGNDEITFNFSANKGIALQPLSKVASGGEMSRVMLALKSVMAEHNDLPSIIFDEIDTGVSGETAGKIGNILQKMGEAMQVIAITHLPQIASKGIRHYRVQKKSDTHFTLTDIVELNENERLHELARLLSGEHITDAALANAQHLLKGNKTAV